MIPILVALTSSKSIIWVCDEDGNLTYSNRSTLTKGKTLESFLSSVHPCDREARARDLRGSLVDQTRKTNHFRINGDGEDGDTVWISEEVDALWRRGQFRGLIGVGVPTTASENGSVPSNSQRPRFAFGKPRPVDGGGILTHEVRNCLSGVLGAVELLRETLTDDRQFQLLDAVRESSDSLLRMLGESLDVFRLEAGDEGPESTVFNPAQNAEKVLLLLQKHAQDRGLHLGLHLEPSIPRFVRGDQARLNQILMNLLSNALKYTEEGTVTLSVAPCPEGLRFEIQDTGPGMSPEFQRSMFAPFERVENGKDSSSSDGVGLGLNICRRLSNLMSGRLECQTELNAGTTFQLIVPFTAVDGNGSAPGNNGSQTTENQVEGLRVLVVEDQPVVRNVLSRQLEKLKLHPIAVSDGQAALDVLELSSVDFVLMDLHLPKMDGIETTRRIRQRFGSEPFIVGITGEAKADVRRRCLEAGMNECLFKPMSIEQLSSFLSSRDWVQEDRRHRV